MGRRAAVVIAAGGICLAVLAGCDDGGQPDPSSEAFTEPLHNKLGVQATTDCPDGQIGPGDTVRVSGEDYVPDSMVKLRWSVPSAGTTGLFPPVAADEKGDFTSSSLKIGRTIAAPGETVELTSEGTSEDGLMVLWADLEVSSC